MIMRFTIIYKKILRYRDHISISVVRLISSEYWEFRRKCQSWYSNSQASFNFASLSVNFWEFESPISTSGRGHYLGWKVTFLQLLMSPFGSNNSLLRALITKSSGLIGLRSGVPFFSASLLRPFTPPFLPLSSFIQSSLRSVGKRS